MRTIITFSLIAACISHSAMAATYKVGVKHGLQLRETLFLTLGAEVYEAADGDALARDLIQRMPETGNYEEVSAPTLLTMVSKTSDICQALIESQNSSNKKDWINEQAMRFWHRGPDPTESDLLQELINGIADEKLARVVACTAMLSSAQFLKN